MHSHCSYSEVQKANRQIEDNYKCTLQLQTVHCEENETNKFEFYAIDQDTLIEQSYSNRTVTAQLSLIN